MKFGLIVALAALSCSAFAQQARSSINGSYAAPSAVRMFGETAADCKSEGGEFEDGACITRDASGNTLDIGKTIVSISVLFGPANEREFSGGITKRTANSVMAEDDDGCKILVQVKAGVASVKTGDACDPNLGRVDGAKKQK